MTTPQVLVEGQGLTTTKAPFIENAVANGEMYITQPYELYSVDNHDAWRRLYARMQDRWARYANPRFLDGLDTLCFNPTQVPRLEDVNQFMAPRTGFRAKAVSGFVPAFNFFDCLSRREFPTTITIRDGGSLDYLPEPDIFHDIAGHVPMHTDPAFAETLVRFGACAHLAAELVSTVPDRTEKLRRLTSIQNALQRFFWFTVEFGLMRGPTPGDLKVYGSGLLSSYGEIVHCVDHDSTQRHPLQLEWVINQHFEIDHYQPLLFIVNDFDHLYELVGQLESWMTAGKLDNVTPGYRQMSEADAQSFLEAFFESTANGHHFAHRLHLGGEMAVGGWEFLKGEPGHLGHDIVDGWLEGGRRGPTGDLILEFIEGVAHGQLRRHLRNGKARGLGGQRRRPRHPGVHLNDDHPAVGRIDRELDIRPPGVHTDLSQNRNRGIAHQLVFLVGEGLGRCHGDGVTGVNAHGIEILNGADDDAVVCAVANHLHLELFPANEGFLNEQLARGRGF